MVLRNQKCKATFLWKHFEKHHEDKSKLYSICKVDFGGAPCGKKLSNKLYSTSGLRSHLASHHIKVYEKLLQDERKKREEKEKDYNLLAKTIRVLEGTSKQQRDELDHDTPGPAIKLSATPSSQISKSHSVLFRQVIKFNNQDKKQLQFDMEVMKFIALSNLSFNIVSSEGFIGLIKFLEPRYHVKSHRTFARSKLPLLYSNVKEAVDFKLQEELPSCDGVAFTTDLWSSRAFDPYLGMTVHFIDQKFNLQKFLIHCCKAEGRHTAQFIASNLDSVVQKLKLNNETARYCTSDNAANMLAAVGKLTNEITGGLGCIDHLLNLIVNASIKAIPEVRDAIESFKKLASRTHKSSLDQQRIRRECDRVSKDDSNPVPVTFCKIITPVETRWNSILMMCRSILSLRPALENIKEDHSKSTDLRLQSAIPEPEEFDLIGSIIKPLAKVEAMSEVLSGDQYVTLPLVIPRLHSISLTLHSMVAKDGPATKKFAQCMLEEFELRFPKCGTENFLYGVGNLLHPFFRGLIIKEFGSYPKIIKQFFEENEEKEEEKPQPKVPESDETMTKDDDDDFDEEGYFKMIAQKHKTHNKSINENSTQTFETAITSLQLEWNRYQNLPDVNDHKVDILGWWAEKKKEFPLLAKAVRKYLCIQATSASCERVFSTGGQTVSVKRTKLDPENVHMLVYCKENLPKVKITKWRYQEPEEEDNEEEMEIEESIFN
jgi:hypothetical protein